MSWSSASSAISSESSRDSFWHYGKNYDYSNGTHDRAALLNWLSPLNSQIQHQDLRSSRVNRVGEWLFQTEQFQSWYDGTRGEKSDNSVLFCEGGPGVGKTYLSSLVIDTLCDRTEEQNIAVACFYFDFLARKVQSPTAILGSLLKQIVGGFREVPEEVSESFEYHLRMNGKKLELLTIVKLLQRVTSLRQTFLCIDAIDECAEEHRSEVLDFLKQILQMSPSTRVFLTGRPQIRGRIENRLPGRSTFVSITVSRDDINTMLRAKLDKDTTVDGMDSNLVADILNSFPQTISDTLLLVSLNIEAVLQETTIYRRRQKLDAIRNGLGLNDAYGATLERIMEQGGEKARLGMAALMWVSHAERPLKVHELCLALAVEIRATDLNTDNVPSISTLLGCCQGLLVLNKEASAVRLLHFTLGEYLFTRPDIFTGPHAIMAETCLTYLNFHQVKGLSPELHAAPQETPFLQYSSIYWGAHARKGFSSRVKSLVLKLFDGFEHLLSTKLLFWDILRALDSIIYDYFWAFLSMNIDDPDLDMGFTKLHCLSFFGLAEIAADFVEMEDCDFNAVDRAGFTPLIWAAMSGHDAVVKFLLCQNNVDPDMQDTEVGRTALSWAAGYGHEPVVKLLLGRAASSSTTVGWTRGAPHVMIQSLRKMYVYPDRPDYCGRTPLSHAAGNAHEGVVKLLFEWEKIDPGRLDEEGREPLSYVAENGNEAVARLLLSRMNFRLEDPKSKRRTPLSYAAQKGHGGLVKLLLNREDVNPGCPDREGRKPLSYAAEYGNVEVVMLLLAREDVEKYENPDLQGRTLLSYAAENGHEAVVKLLLEWEYPGHFKLENYPPNPLPATATLGEFLLGLGGWDDLKLNEADKAGQTPLLRAARQGHEGVVKLLLGKTDVDPNTPNKRTAETALLIAAVGGHEGIVRALLARRDIDLNKQNNLRDTPLLWAARQGSTGVVKLLLEQPGIDPEKLDGGDRTPLSHAAQNGHTEVVKLLLERRDVIPDRPDFLDQTPMSFAAGNGHEEVMKLLLAREDFGNYKLDTYTQGADRWPRERDWRKS